MRDIKEFHADLYSIPDKSKHDAFILKYCRAVEPNPKTKKGDAVKGKSINFQYSTVNQAGNNVKVCRDPFLKVVAPIT